MIPPSRSSRPMKITTARTFTSEASAPGAGRCGTPWGLALVGVFMHDGELQSGILLWKEWQALEPMQKEAEPDAAHAEQGCKIRPAHVNASFFRAGPHHPKDIHQVGEKNHAGQEGEAIELSFGGTEQQQEKRNEKMKEGEENDNPSPTARGAAHIPGNLVRQIAGPDNEHL